MAERTRVRVYHFADRPNLVLLWRDLDTGRVRTRSAGSADPARAEQARADLEYELNHGQHAGGERLGWARFRALFEAEHLADRREGTRKAYAKMFDLFERLCRPTRLGAITERVVSAFAARMRTAPGRISKDGFAAQTVKNRLQELRTALRWAVGQRLLAECPRFPRVKVPKKRPQAVPAESVEKLLAAAPDEHWRCFLLCAWLAGLRRDEARRLEWERSERRPWLDLAGDQIVLPAEAVKGNEDQTVPLDPQLRAALEALPRRGKRVLRLRLPGGSTPSGSGASCYVGRLARQAGVRLNYKALRRGFGCRYAARVPAQVLQRLMRHASITTTMQYYVNVEDAAREAVLGKRPGGMHNTSEAPSPQE